MARKSQTNRMSTYSTIDYRGRKYLVIHANSDQEFDCPFCGASHTHGTANGHRIAHCGTGKYKEEIELHGLGVFKQQDGYFIQYD